MTNPHQPVINPTMTRELITDTNLIVHDWILAHAPADVLQVYNLADELNAYLINCEAGCPLTDQRDHDAALRNACDLRRALNQSKGAPAPAPATKRPHQPVIESEHAYTLIGAARQVVYDQLKAIAPADLFKLYTGQDSLSAYMEACEDGAIWVNELEHTHALRITRELTHLLEQQPAEEDALKAQKNPAPAAQPTRKPARRASVGGQRRAKADVRE